MPIAKHTIRIENRNLFDNPIVMIAYGEKSIELYVDEGGLEMPAGRLDHHLDAEDDKIVCLLKAIKDRILENPLSDESRHWLSCLAYGGMLEWWKIRR